jgi:hypothetical protein
MLKAIRYSCPFIIRIQLNTAIISSFVYIFALLNRASVSWIRGKG